MCCFPIPPPLAPPHAPGVHYTRIRELYQKFLYNTFNQCLSHRSNSTMEKEEKVENTDKTSKIQSSTSFLENKLNEPANYDKVAAKDDSDIEERWKWKLEAAWLSKALEPALHLYKWASSSGTDAKKTAPTSSRSFIEILTNLQKSKTGIEDWSLSDFTVGLYLFYLKQTSAQNIEKFEGVQISSEAMVQELIYHLELAKGAYKGDTTALARHSMVQEKNVVKFIRNSSVMRPGYYIAIDTRKKLVVFVIRGTHTVYDLVTDVVSSSDQEISFEGYSTHFGIAEAARWFLRHEMGTIRKCLEKYKDYKLRLVGHSLGGAAAALLAIMLRKKSAAELGFDPEIVTAVGFGTPPCVSKELAKSCASYVLTVVLQDDIIPRLSAFALAKLRNEILETDWVTILEKEDWKGIVDFVTNAKQVFSSVQDVSRKLADYAKLKNISSSLEGESHKEAGVPPKESKSGNGSFSQQDRALPEELFIPGTFYYLKRDTGDIDIDGKKRTIESYTLWKRAVDEDFRRIMLSGNLFSDHRCESHYYALRDVLKSLPASDSETHLVF